MRRQRLALPLAGLLAALPACLMARTPDALQVRSWAAACANCHGTHGQAQPGIDALAGVGREVLLRKLLDFKSGAKPATLMHQLARGYSDTELAAIAGYFAAQKAGSTP